MIEGTRFGYWKACFKAMGSPCELLVDTTDPGLAQDGLAVAVCEVDRIEKKLSRYRDDSVVAEINRSEGKPVELDAETSALLDLAHGMYERSDGRFDITSGVLRQAWTFDGREAAPSAELVASLLEKVGWSEVRWESPQLTLPAGMEIDLGGIGKEYAADRVAALLARKGWHALINLGGDLVTTGPRPSGEPWIVGLESAATDGAGSKPPLELQAGAIATSGSTERYVIVDGERRGHILDPRTGWPLQHAPQMITVRAETCTTAGALAQLAMLSEKDAARFLTEQGVEHWCVW